MNIKTREVRGVWLVTISGKITIGVGDVAIRDCIQQLLSKGARRIVVDFHLVTTIDSSGVGEIISAYTSAAHRNTILWYAHYPQKVNDILLITQLITVVPFFPTAGDAIESALEATYVEGAGVTFPADHLRRCLLGAWYFAVPPDLGSFTNLRRLFIYYSGLEKLPNGMGKLTNLESLYASNNQIGSLPAEIGNLRQLRILSADHNALTELPDELGQLACLETMSLANNQLRRLPSTIGALSALTDLKLAGNQLRRLPPEIGKLAQLQDLNLASNDLTSLPSSIGNLANLATLDLSENTLAELPASIGRLGSLRSFALDDNRVSRLPAEIGGLAALTELRAARNRLARLPHQIGDLHALNSLTLDENQLAGLPATLQDLTNLEHLSLVGNGMRSLTPAIRFLTRLKSLHLAGNELETLPAEIGSLESLVELDVEANQLTHLPAEIGNLRRLETLRLAHNRLTDLPRQIGSLDLLTTCDLEDNQLRELPPEMGKLASLRSLNLRSNRLQRIPDTLASLRWLRGLDLHDNLLTAPPEVLDRDYDAKHILRFLRAAAAEERRPIGAAKVLLVGEPGVGKTSLARRLLQSTFDPAEEPTRGLAITSMPWHLRDQKMTLNIWDFGGQEILHATHQFFLTKRSVYLVVADCRLTEAENRLTYWLKLVHSVAGNSPILIVANKLDQSSLDLERDRLMKSHPQLRSIVGTSCLTGEGIDDLRTVLLREVAGLEHLLDEVPLSWHLAKTRLQELAVDVLPYHEFSAICDQCGLHGRQNQRELASFLHDIGDIINYYDDPRLEHTQILNPRWLTTGVYAILNSNLLFQNHGVLEIADLSSILDSERYPRQLWTPIVDIMRRFELCFPFEGGDGRYLVPDLLSRLEPFVGDWSDALGFEYRYDVLPRSVLSRLIVRLHAFIHQRLVWRSGVVLAYDDNLALIRGDVEAATIAILITGYVPGRPVLLRTIRFELEAIHRSLPGIVVQGRLATRSRPQVTVALDHLKTLQQMGIEEFVPEGGCEMVKVSDLLAAVEVEGESRRGRGPAAHDGKRVDVFIAYSSDDRSSVSVVTAQLRQRGLDAWLDVDRMIPGRWFQDTLQEGLARARSAAIFVGTKGIGRWEQVELRTLLASCVERDMPVIPVLLPGVESVPESLAFLRQLTPVRFRRSVHEREGLDLLEWGIRGRLLPAQRQRAARHERSATTPQKTPAVRAAPARRTPAKKRRSDG